MQKWKQTQLTLDLIAETPAEWMECRGLFSASYIRNHVTAADFIPTPEAASAIYDAVKTLWFEHYEALWRQGERYTCSAFIEPVLRLLGWELLPEKGLPLGQFAKKRPDFCLYADADAFRKASTTTDPGLREAGYPEKMGKGGAKPGVCFWTVPRAVSGVMDVKKRGQLYMSDISCKF